MSIRGKFLGREALTRRLRAFVPDAETEMAAVQLEAAEELASAIESRAPIGMGDTAGDYRASIHGGRLADNPGKAIMGVGATKDKNATGIFADFKWRWLEFGTDDRRKKSGASTGKMPAQPHIFPTYRAMKKKIRRKVASALNRAVRRASK